jgi:steroid 5-alpha reductase family enzyme
MDWGLVLWAWMVTIPMMVGLWSAYRWYLRNAALADVGFCVGLGLVSMGLGVMTGGDVSHRVVVAAMGTGYAFRLGGHIFHTRILDATEDPRYQLLREKLGSRAEWWIFGYFIAQALAIAVFSVPLLVLMANPHDAWSVWELAGIVIWIVGVAGEAIADRQLNYFRQQSYNKGKTCREGLWRYSRHPNYFFEGVHWCAYVMMGIGLTNSWLTLVGPVLMIWALLKVSGIPLAEAQALASRGDEYREYQRTTNAFIPWFPKGVKH